MAASVSSMATVSGISGGVVSVKNVSSLSSSASFGSPLVNVAPLRAAANCNVVAVRANLSEEQKSTFHTGRRELLASLVAAGAFVANEAGVLAAAGPGTQGSRRTNEKAGQLLKAADDLTNNDSPPRFGPGSVGGDSGRVAQQAGAGAIEGLQEGTTKAIDDAKKNVLKAKSRIDGIFQKKNKTGDLADISIGNPAEKVSSDLQTTGEKVKSDISSASGKAENNAGSFFGLGGKKVEETKKTADDLLAQAQKNGGKAASDSSDKGKNIFDNLKDKAQNLVPQ